MHECVFMCIIYSYIRYIHYAILTSSNLSNFIENTTSNTVLLLLLVVYCTFSDDSSCPGGPRYKPLGVSRGSPRSQLCIYCIQLMYIYTVYIYNVVIVIENKVLFYSILRLAQTRQVSRITHESHGFWQFLKAHGGRHNAHGYL